MADQREIKIPVFSVLKNGVNLKNIFLNNPQWESTTQDQEQETDPILIGRHPDCHIVLDHPSISRFHLEIRAKPVLQKLSVIDRSSVHGTWVSGRKIQANVPVDLNEGDTVKLGASTRVYKLHWVPMSCAYEMEMILETVIEENEETHQLENLDVKIKEIPSAPPLPESFTLPLEEENEGLIVKELGERSPGFCSVFPMSESIGSSVLMDEESSTPEKNVNTNEVLQSERGKSSSILSRRIKSKSVSSLCIKTGRNKEKSAALEESKKEETLFRALFENEKENEEEENFVSAEENIKSRTPVIPPRHGLMKSPEGDDAFYSDKENWTPEVSGSKKFKKPVLAEPLKVDRGEIFFSDKENMTPEGKKSKKPLQEEEFFSEKENLTPESGVKKSNKKLSESLTRMEREITESRRKERIPFQSLLKNSPLNNNSPVSNNKRVVDKERSPFKFLIEKSPSKIRSPLGSEPQRRETKEKIPYQSLLENSPLKNSSPLKHAQSTVEKERAPVESLQTSPLENRSPVSSAQRAEDTSNKYSSFIHNQRTEDELSNSSSQSVEQVLPETRAYKNKWYMVVDTACFLNPESRKAIQLLEGLKGTQLIIPRIVIRELDCLKRREGLFRKNTTRAASSVLQWIEECMVRSSWWIHVQSSLETMPVAPTPPATPRSPPSDGSGEMAFFSSTSRSLMEIVSPTEEDHILDCALLFKKMKDAEHLVMLTDSTILKIKAMAEGLLCEAPVEFRESLVNPYSKRFLWSDSSPRGSTWSCLGEVGLFESYYCQLSGERKAARATENVKVLKLILLHNSHYGKTS
ncbi:FHA domain-containing protein PS1 [Asparagus officinalis]|uniref:FHA domain-containing protein PS1 n=1 Tax=Asparagus officinalis TaxID=4686 RepID=UPI00098E33C1|nr:FHA domain-containing protein PS1 [Asparagus officinalis]